MKVLVAVDLQNDFVTGSLGTEEARAIVSAAAEKIKTFDGLVLFTRDTHGEDYPHRRAEDCRCLIAYGIRKDGSWWANWIDRRKKRFLTNRLSAA